MLVGAVIGFVVGFVTGMVSIIGFIRWMNVCDCDDFDKERSDTIYH